MSLVGPYNPDFYQDSPTSNIAYINKLIKYGKAGWKAGKRIRKAYNEYTASSQNKKQKKMPKKLTQQQKKNWASVKKSMAHPMTYDSNPNKALTTRSSMKVTGKTKTKVSKTVAVPSRLRKQIKQVLVGQQATGQYETIKEGYVGAIFVADGIFALPLNGDDLGVSTQPAVFPTRNTQIPGRTLFNQLVTRNPANDPAAVIAGTGMNYFTPAKFIDAASVLFNKKVLNRNPYLTTGNLSTVFATASGAPAVTNYGTLKINILKSYVTFSIKNLSNRVVTLEIWECMPTKMFQEANSLADLATTLSTLATSTTFDSSFDYADAGGSGVGQLKPENTLFEIGLDPLEIAKRNFGYKWTWKKRLMILAPEETCIHSIRGPKGIFDFKKLNTTVNPDAPAQTFLENSLAKGFSVSCIFAVSGDQVLADRGQGGRKLFLGNGNTVLSCPVAVEVKEFYKVAVPEIAGFVTQDGADGETQMLNLRKQKHIIFSQKERGNNQYNVSNEVNPIAEGTPNAQNQ